MPTVNASADDVFPFPSSGVAGAIRSSLDETLDALQALPSGPVGRVAQALARVYRQGGTVYILGNGGSASTAEHFVCDLTKASKGAGGRPLSLVAPTANSALVTALANDSSYPDVFAEQLEGTVAADDVVIAISASGNSPNVLRAVEVAQRNGAFTIGLTGFGGGRLEALVDLALVVESHDYGVVENVHLAVEHAVTAAFGAALHAEANDGATDPEAMVEVG